MCDTCVEWDGRIWHKKPGGSYYQTRLLLHREIWKSERGPIPDGHHVHHVNGDIHDNRIDNLELLSSGAHSRLHCREKLDPYKDKAREAAQEASRRNREIRIRTRRLKCIVCGASYGSGAPKPAVYCSTRCLEKLRSGFHGDRRICEQCGAPYTAKRRAQKYCGMLCNRAACANREPIQAREIICGHCRVAFLSKRSNATFCSRKCAVAFHEGSRFRRTIKASAASLRPND